MRDHATYPSTILKYLCALFHQETDSYNMSVFSEKSVPLFGPSLPAGPAVFKRGEAFRRFILVKMINGEKAT